MTEQSPLERAARAAIEAERNMRGIDLGSPLWGREIARAVLMAVRSPSEKMVEAGKEQTDFAADAWAAMIDAALGE